MELNRVKSILNNDEKFDIFYNKTWYISGK